MTTKTKKSKSWVYTRKRREATVGARKRHSQYVKLGRRAYERGAR